MLDGPQVVRLLHLPEEQGVVPVRLHRVAGHHGAVQRQRGQQRPEVADLVRLAGLGDLVLGDDHAGGVGDGGEQVHLLVPAGLGALAFLAVHGHGVPGGDVPGIPRDRGIQPGVERVRPEPAVLPLLRGSSPPPALRFRFFSLLPPAPCCRRAVRGIRGRDLRDPARAAATPPVRAASNSSASSSFPTLSSIDADGATRSPVRGLTRQPCAASTLLVPARRRLRDRQRPPVPARRARRPAPIPATPAHAASPASCAYRSAAPPAPPAAHTGSGASPQPGGGGAAGKP